MNSCIDENMLVRTSSDSQDENKCLDVSDSDTLLLKSQGLSKLPKNATNVNMISIILEENLFCDLPSEICLMQNVKVLNIAKNKIDTLPDEIGNLINLEHLDVSENNLEKLPSSLSMASKLLILNASKNKIREIPHEYKNLKKLTRVNFAYNELTEVPIALTLGSHCISVLDLSHNIIKDLSKEPKCSTSLKVLKINNNFITDLPCWIRCLQTIEELHLGNNPFTMECRQSLDNMNSLSSITLKKLSVTSCGLTHLPASLKNMPNLLYLDVGSETYSSDKLNMCNAIWDADPLLNMVYLRELRLSYVSLPVLPESIWKTLKCLEVLDLRGNNLTWLPDGISNLFNLILCTLSDNRLALLPADIGNVKSLKELNLDRNKLCDLPDSFGKLENLAYLDLYDNELSEFPLAVCQLHSLKYLDVEMNYFSINEASDKVPERLSVNYSAMKDRLRSFHVSKQNRVDRVKELPSSNVSEDNNFTSQKSRSPSPVNFECQPDLHDSLYNCSIEDDEDWDKSDGSDNFFDPTYSQAVKESRSQWHWARDNGRWEPPVSGDAFCPADIHPDTLPKPSNKTKVCINDGQFDDADDMAD